MDRFSKPFRGHDPKDYNRLNRYPILAKSLDLELEAWHRARVSRRHDDIRFLDALAMFNAVAIVLARANEVLPAFSKAIKAEIDAFRAQTHEILRVTDIEIFMKHAIGVFIPVDLAGAGTEVCTRTAGAMAKRCTSKGARLLLKGCGPVATAVSAVCAAQSYDRESAQNDRVCGTVQADVAGWARAAGDAHFALNYMNMHLLHASRRDLVELDTLPPGRVMREMARTFRYGQQHGGLGGFDNVDRPVMIKHLRRRHSCHAERRAIFAYLVARHPNGHLRAREALWVSFLRNCTGVHSTGTITTPTGSVNQNSLSLSCRGSRVSLSKLRPTLKRVLAGTRLKPPISVSELRAWGVKITTSHQDTDVTGITSIGGPF